VTAVKPAAVGTAPELTVKNPSDGKTMAIPGNLAAVSGRAIQLKVTVDQLAKSLN
jgi:hypothetical protein